MKKIYFFKILKVKYGFFIPCILLPFIFSCAGFPVIEPEYAASSVPVDTVFPLEEEMMDITPDLPPKKPELSLSIMGKGNVPGEKMAFFLLNNNPQIDFNYVLMLANFYVEESAFEGVNHDIAFAQMSLETGFLRFGNLVTADQYNFAGLGATGLPDADGNPDKGLCFPDPRTGVRAHVQHLKAYASTEPLNGDLVNPRRRFVKLGSSPTIEGLAGTWAADRNYGEKINIILDRLYDFAF